MLMRLLRTYLRPYAGPLAIVFTLQLAQAIANLFLPSLNADIIDNGVLAGDTAYILRTGGVMLAVTLVQVAATMVAVYYGARTAMALGRDVRAAVFGRVQVFSARGMAQFGAPSLITRSTNDVQQVQMVVMLALTLLIAAPVMAVGGVIMALRENVQLSGLLLLVIPVLLVTLGFVISRMRPLFRSLQIKIDGINRIMREQITGIRVIRAFVRDDHERARFEESNADLRQVGIQVGRLMALMFPLVMLIMNVTSVGVLWFGGQQIDSGGMQVGELTAFLQYIMQILMAVMMATMMFMIVPRAEVSAERISEVLDTESSVVPSSNPVTDLTGHGHLELRDVRFGYPGAEEDVLHDVSFRAEPGKTTAIIGSTGAGKTTLLSLVPRLFDVTGGAVLVDGVDIRDLSPETLWAHIGLVPQKPFLFSGTVASNLRFGDENATDDELWHALEIAQASGFVQEMGGLEAEISQGGTNVSGGQRQRLAIARALVRKPSIYLFDDSFSALDYATDAALRRALAPETREATVLVVAQRVSTIRHAERIVVLDEGRVVGEGTHAELMADNETYREIVLSQITESEAA
jgi:ATP-binding cassette, subfamily B, multidrug efflux pump